MAALEQAFVQAAQTHTEKLGLNTTTQRTLQVRTGSHVGRGITLCLPLPPPLHIDLIP